MRYRMAAIAAAALLCTVSAVSCGKDSDSSSVSVKIGNTTEASSEAASEDSTEKTSSAEEKTTEKASEEKTTEAATEEETTEAETTEEKTTEAATQEKTTEEKTEPKASSREIDGNSFIGFEINELKDVLGEQSGTYTAEACLPVGEDGNAYVYDFDGLEAECYLQEDMHYICKIAIKSNKYSIPGGITVGSSKNDVQAAYADAAVQGNGDMNYHTVTYDIYFTMSGDSVAEIEYLLNY
jgi:hypothetical protein